MFSKIFSKAKPRLKYREIATVEEFDFIIGRCTAEAQDGHFSDVFGTSDPDIQEGLRYQMACAVNDMPYPFEPGNPRHGTGAKMLLIEQGEERVGFVLLLEDMPGSWHQKMEIHLVSILPNVRGTGIGKQLVNDIPSMTKAKEIYARCYPQSVAMMNILKRAGFKATKVSQQGTTTLTLKR